MLQDYYCNLICPLWLPIWLRLILCTYTLLISSLHLILKKWFYLGPHVPTKTVCKLQLLYKSVLYLGGGGSKTMKIWKVTNYSPSARLLNISLFSQLLINNGFMHYHLLWYYKVEKVSKVSFFFPRSCGEEFKAWSRRQSEHDHNGNEGANETERAREAGDIRTYQV